MELRMYGLVNYQLTGIQQGIQFGHAVVEYGQNMKKLGDQLLSNQYDDWADNHKTFILLSGGTTNTNIERLGTMNQYLKNITDMGVYCVSFYEPDLGDQMTSIVFIVDERVFNKEKYPDFDLKQFYGNEKLDYKSIYEDPFNPKFPNKYSIIGNIHIKPEWDKWVESIGGRKNLFLRIFLKNFRLA